MKKFVLIIACLLLAVFCFAACSSEKTTEYGEEILSNGSFAEKVTDYWTLVAHSEEENKPSLKTAADGSTDADAVGKHYLQIEADKYSGYEQDVTLEKNSYYCLSAKIRLTSSISVENDDILAGAFLAIDSDYDLVSEALRSTTGGWKTVNVYFNSGDRTSAVVRFGVGTEKHTADGSADFGVISLTKLESAPVGVFVNTLSKDASSLPYHDAYRTNSEGKLFMILAVVLGAACLFAAYAAFRTLMGRKDAFLSPDDGDRTVSFFKSSAFMLIICELLAFAVRLILINFVYGGSTLGGFVSDATHLTDLGAATYYYEEQVLTPIGSLYLLWVMGLLASPLGLVTGGMGFAIFLKIPAVLADLVIVFLIYYLANRKYNQYISAIFAGVYAVIPTFFFLSAGWGAYASIGVLFVLLSLIAILDKKYVASIIYFAVALLFSAEVMLILPLYLAYLCYVFFKTDDYKMGISITLTSSIIVLYLISIPFILSHFVEGHPFIVVKRYCQAFLAHTGFTENAFSIYGLFGLGSATANTASYVFNGILVGLMTIYTILLFFKSKSRLDLLLLSAFAFVFTFVMTSAVDTLLVYFALALLLAYGITTGDRRVLKLFGGLSLTTLVNTSYAMMIGGYFGTGTNSALVLMTAADPVLIVFSVANLLLLAYFAYITASICIKEEVKGVVIVEGNYFKYVWSLMKKCATATAVFFTETLPALFKKKQADEENAEDGNAR